MTSIDEISDLRDRRNQKVYGLVVVDRSFRFKYSCSFCDGEFLSPDSIKNHIEAQHFNLNPPEPTAPTDNGNYVKPESSFLRTDYNESEQEIGVMENVCFNTESAISSTNQDNGPVLMSIDVAPNAEKQRTKSFIQCDFCPKTYESLQNKRLHMRKEHSAQLTHICLICPKAFNNQMDLEAHIENHTKTIKPQPCFFCGKDLRSKYEEKTHMKQCHPKLLRKYKKYQKQFKDKSDHHDETRFSNTQI